MSATDRPWWASDDPGAAPGRDPGAHGREPDPLEAHRRARRGPTSHARAEASGDGPPADDGSWWVPATEAVTRLARDLAASAVASPPRGLLDDLPDADRDPGADHDPGADPDADARGDADDQGGSGSGQADGTGRPGSAHRIDACGVCPICVGLRALGDARPELTGHLIEAARHLALAVRTVVDAATDDGEAADPSRPPRRTDRDDLQHIDLDADEEPPR